MKEEMEINKEKSESLLVKSHLQNLEGKNAEIRLARTAEGVVPLTAFFDIDLTFLNLEELLYPEVRRKLWPNIDSSKVDDIHLAGFRLGTMFKEMYRMKMLNDNPDDDKYSTWADADYYEKDFLETEGQNINLPGDEYHEIAATELKRFDEMATQIARDIYKKDPESYDKAKIGPVFQLAEEYKRLGVPMVGMTANPRGFILEILKYTGLADKFIECATDDDVPGDKEHKMKWLIEKLEQDNIPVSYNRLEVIGDSVTGDVGSGPRFEHLMAEVRPELDIKTHGLLIVENESALSKARQKLATRPLLEKDLIGSARAQALRWDKVKKSPYGTFSMTSKYRSEFLEPIVFDSKEPKSNG
ncbi:MAG: hypothetical protein WC621_00100 [Patescibacteria group bacterium]